MGGKNSNIDLEQIHGLAEMLLSGEGQVPDAGDGLLDILSADQPAQAKETPQSAIDDYERWKRSELPDDQSARVAPTPQSAIDAYEEWKRQPGARFSTVPEEDAMYPTAPPVQAPPEGQAPSRFRFGQAIIEDEE